MKSFEPGDYLDFGNTIGHPHILSTSLPTSATHRRTAYAGGFVRALANLPLAMAPPAATPPFRSGRLGLGQGLGRSDWSLRIMSVLGK